MHMNLISTINSLYATLVISSQVYRVVHVALCVVTSVVMWVDSNVLKRLCHTRFQGRPFDNVMQIIIKSDSHPHDIKPCVSLKSA
jgi:hypothetical protein